MLKSWRAWLLAIFGLIVVVLILANSLSFQACMQETRDYYASEGIPYFFLKGLENCVGSYIIAKHAVITAFATAFIAWFTYTLWNANREQIKRTREIERAYISGGGPLDRNNLNNFIFTIDNYGKTPAIMLEYAVEFCRLNNIPPVPAYNASNYRRTAFRDRIRPNTTGRPLKAIPIPNDISRPLLAYGRYWFEDNWKDKHTAGFVLLIEANTTHGHIPVSIPSAYTDWD